MFPDCPLQSELHILVETIEVAPNRGRGGGQRGGDQRCDSNIGSKLLVVFLGSGVSTPRGRRGRSSSMFPLEVSVSKKRMKKCLTAGHAHAEDNHRSSGGVGVGGAFWRRTRGAQLLVIGGQSRGNLNRRGNTEVQHTRIKTQLRVYSHTHLICLMSVQS